MAIHQPQFMPWLGYFDKMDQADVFVLLDNVQYKKNEWQNRNRIKTAGGVQWLTVPVSYSFPALIKEVAVNDAEPWQRKHRQALKTNYARSDYWEDAQVALQGLYEQKWEMLADLNHATVEWLRAELEIDTELILASKMEVSDDPAERLVEICLTLGARRYIAGADGRLYMDLGRFERAGIEVVFQDYVHPHYPQLYGEFQSHLSTLDLLFNCGRGSAQILRSGRSSN